MVERGGGKDGPRSGIYFISNQLLKRNQKVERRNIFSINEYTLWMAFRST
jgi:hypothetical protein